MSSWWLKALEGVGEEVVKDTVPGGGAIIGLVNKFLPGDKKLPDSATGTQAIAAVQNLTPEQRTQLESQQLDLQKTAIEQVNQTMRVEETSSDPYVRHARPSMLYAAKDIIAFEVIASISGVIGAVMYALISGHDVLKTAQPVVQLIVQVNQSLMYQVIVLLSACGVYVKKRSDDKVIAAGNPPKPGIIQSLIGAIKG